MKKILVGLSALAMVAACETTPTSNSTPYPANVKNVLMENCASDKRLTAFCGCFISNIEKRVPLEQFVADVDRYGKATWDQPVYRTAALSCIDKVPAEMLN